MQCKRCQAAIDGFRTLGDLRCAIGIEPDIDDGLCSRCWAVCELCGLERDRPLTTSQAAAALSLPRPIEGEGQSMGQRQHRLCVSCRSMQETTQQQRAKISLLKQQLDGTDEHLGGQVRLGVLKFLDSLLDDEIGRFVRIFASGDLVEASKMTAQLVQLYRKRTH